MDSRFGEVRDERNETDDIIVTRRESSWCFHDMEGLYLPSFEKKLTDFEK